MFQGVSLLPVPPLAKDLKAEDFYHPGSVCLERERGQGRGRRREESILQLAKALGDFDLRGLRILVMTLMTVRFVTDMK